MIEAPRREGIRRAEARPVDLVYALGETPAWCVACGVELVNDKAIGGLAREAPQPQEEGFAIHTLWSNHCRVGEASNGAACSEWGEEPAEDECALLSPAAAVAMEGRLAA